MCPMFGGCISVFNFWASQHVLYPVSKQYSDSILQQDQNKFHKTVASVHVQGNNTSK